MGTAATSRAAPPAEIANVVPDFATEYPNVSPHLVTGEGFEPGKGGGGKPTDSRP